MEQSIGDQAQTLFDRFREVAEETYSQDKKALTLEIVAGRIATLLKDANDELLANLRSSVIECQELLPEFGLFKNARTTLDKVINRPNVS